MSNVRDAVTDWLSTVTRDGVVCDSSLRKELRENIIQLVEILTPYTSEMLTIKGWPHVLQGVSTDNPSRALPANPAGFDEFSQ